MGRVVDELALEPRKRYYKPLEESVELLRYELEGIRLELYLDQLVQVASFEGLGSIVSSEKAKQACQ